MLLAAPSRDQDRPVRVAGPEPSGGSPRVQEAHLKDIHYRDRGQIQSVTAGVAINEEPRAHRRRGGRDWTAAA